MQLVSLVYFRSTTRIDTHWWLPLQFLHTTPDDGHAPCPKHVERKKTSETSCISLVIYLQEPSVLGASYVASDTFTS